MQNQITLYRTRSFAPGEPDCPQSGPGRGRPGSPRAFTLIELLVTIGIIVILIGILIPVVSKVRTSAQTANTQGMLSNLQNAITVYSQNNGGAFPGPISNDQIYANGNAAPYGAPAIYAPGGPLLVDAGKITMSENLVLGLLGGLYVDTANGNKITFDSSRVGQGPMGLNTGNPAVNRRSEPYFQYTSSDLSKGHYSDGSGDADDSSVPEFLDKYPNQMPILYLRAKSGANPSNTNHTVNPVMTDDLGATNVPPRVGQYDLSQIISYTGAFTGTWSNYSGLTLDGTTTPAAPSAAARSIGEGKKISSGDYVKYTPVSTPFHGLRSVDANLNASLQKNAAAPQFYQYPYDAYAYFKDPNSSSTNPAARMKDQYILISAGPDRVYGTKDDIVTFGDINP